MELFEKSPIIPGSSAEWYFITRSGRYVHQSKIKEEAVSRGLFHYLSGKHIMTQMEALGILEHFNTGFTPYSCPYSFF